MKNLNPQLELFLQAAGFNSREERAELIKKINDEISQRVLKKFADKYSPEEIANKLKSGDSEIGLGLSESVKEVLTELVELVAKNSTPEEKEKFISLSQLLGENTNP